MTFRELERQVAQGRISPAYFFYGPEEYLKTLAIEKIAAAFIGGPKFRQGLESISATEQDGTDIVQRTQTLGMFSDKRVIAVGEIEALAVKGRKMILEYLKNPSPDVCLILCSVDLDKKTVFYKGLSEAVPTVIFYLFGEEEAARWIVSVARNKGMAITSDDARFLLDVSGSQLGVLEKEIEKFDLYLPGGGPRRITREDIKALAGASCQVASYELADAVCGKDTKRALELYEKLLSSGEDPAALLRTLYLQLEKLWKTALMSARGDSPREISRTIRSSEYFVNQMLSVAEKWGGRHYLEAMQEIYRAEYRLKSGRAEPRSDIQRLIYTLSS